MEKTFGRTNVNILGIHLISYQWACANYYLLVIFEYVHDLSRSPFPTRSGNHYTHSAYSWNGVASGMKGPHVYQVLNILDRSSLRWVDGQGHDRNEYVARVRHHVIDEKWKAQVFAIVMYIINPFVYSLPS